MISDDMKIFDRMIELMLNENDYLRNDSRKQNLTDVEREILNSEVAGLSYQLKVLKDTENKWGSEKANLQHSVHSYEISSQKLREQEARLSREVNVLIDKLNDRDNNDKNYDRLNAEVNAAKGSYQVWFRIFTLVYNSGLLIIFIYRLNLTLKEKKD